MPQDHQHFSTVGAPFRIRPEHEDAYQATREKSIGFGYWCAGVPRPFLKTLLRLACESFPGSESQTNLDTVLANTLAGWDWAQETLGRHVSPDTHTDSEEPPA